MAKPLAFGPSDILTSRPFIIVTSTRCHVNLLALCSFPVLSMCYHFPMSRKILSPFALAMIAVSAILTLRNIPIMAEEGLTAIFFYLAAAITFLIPSALVCAELATRLPSNGGIYTWVKTAFGKRLGFLAIWMEWLNNVIAYPATLITILATLSYLGHWHYQQHKWLLFILMMIILWGLTFYNFLGVKIASCLNELGALFGVIIPGVFIILGLIWWSSGHPLAFINEHSHFLPMWHWHSLVFFISVLSGYSGMQILSFHAQNVEKPNHSFPLGIFVATIIILTVSILVALAIAAVVPADQIHLVDGVIEAFSVFFAQFHMTWFTPVMALLIALGVVASLSAWLLGPARGLARAAEDQLLPKALAKQNKYEMPTGVLILQASIASVLGLLFLFMPSIKMAFWVLIALTSQFTVLMYILVFASVVRLRFAPSSEGAFQIPGGRFFLIAMITIAILVCLLGFVLGWLPPTQLHVQFEWRYIALVLVCDLVILGLPVLWLGHKT